MLKIPIYYQSVIQPSHTNSCYLKAETWLVIAKHSSMHILVYEWFHDSKVANTITEMLLFLKCPENHFT